MLLEMYLDLDSGYILHKGCALATNRLPRILKRGKMVRLLVLRLWRFPTSCCADANSVDYSI